MRTRPSCSTRAWAFPVSAVADRRRCGSSESMGVLSAAAGRGGVIAFFTRPFYQIYAVPTTRPPPATPTPSSSAPPLPPARRAPTRAPKRSSTTSSSPRGDASLPRLTYRVRDRDLAIVHTSYHVQGAALQPVSGETSAACPTAPGTSSFPFWNQPLPSRRTEYYTARSGRELVPSRRDPLPRARAGLRGHALRAHVSARPAAGGLEPGAPGAGLRHRRAGMDRGPQRVTTSTPPSRCSPAVRPTNSRTRAARASPARRPWRATARPSAPASSPGSASPFPPAREHTR